MFCVRFLRNDGKEDEEYYYHHLYEATYHFHLFDDDNSFLYRKIQVTEYGKGAPKVLLEAPYPL